MYLRAFPREADDHLECDELVLQCYADVTGVDPGDQIWVSDIPDAVWDLVEQRQGGEA